MSILVTGIEIPKEGHITVHICADGKVIFNACPDFEAYKRQVNADGR